MLECPCHHLALQLVQLVQRNVQEVARTAGRIKYLDGTDPINERLQGRSCRPAVCVRSAVRLLELLPLRTQRLHHHRLDQGLDVGPRCVVPSELAAFLRIEYPLEQCAEDGRLYLRPVQSISLGERVHDDVANVNVDVGAVEQSTVESRNLRRCQFITFRHVLDELCDPTGEQVRRRAAQVACESGNFILAEKLHVAGEHAEQHLRQELRYLGVFAGIPLLQRRRDAVEHRRRLLSQILRRRLGFQTLWKSETGLQHLKHRQRTSAKLAQRAAMSHLVADDPQIIQSDVVDLRDGAREVGVNPDLFKVGYDRQWRVTETVAVLDRLRVRRV